MQYQSMNEQLEKFINILKENEELMDILDYVDKMNLPNYYIVAGSIFQTIWNYYDKKDLNYGIKDIDIVYYNKEDIQVETDINYYHQVRKYIEEKGYSYDIDVSNEARMHLWKKEHNKIETLPYRNTEDAISKWIVTVHSVGITKENGNMKVYAPYGLADIFSRTLRPIKHSGNTKELYDKKVKSWKERFQNLNIIEW